MARLSINNPKIRHLMARGYTLANAQVAVRKAEQFQREAAAEAVKMAARDEALAKRAAAAPPLHGVSVRARARQIQRAKNLDLGQAQLIAERERVVADAQRERELK